MIVHVNGEAREFDHELTVDTVLAKLSLPPERVAVELNHRVIPRTEWPSTMVRDADRLEIVHFVGGG